MPRPFALIRTHDQWLRVSHDATALLGEVVQLAWDNDKATNNNEASPFTEQGAGLAFDQYCRLYHSVPSEGRVERLLWATLDSSQPADAVNLFAPNGETTFGEFVLSDAKPATLQAPRGVVVDDDDRLFIAETDARQILIYDLWSNRLLRRVPLNAAPIDLVVHGRNVYVLLTDAPGLLKLDARSEPQSMSWPNELVEPSRLAVAPSGELFILTGAGTVTARVWQYRGTADPTAITFPTGKAKQTGDTLPFATDIEFQPSTEVFGEACATVVLVVARRPGEDFRRFCLSATGIAEMPPLKARDYDGLGIVRTPDGRIGFWTSHGFSHAAAARLRYKINGTVTTFRLDSGEFHTVWGRLFLDACIPRDTQIIVRCVTADEPPEDAAIVRSRPVNTKENPPHKNQSPPMPSASLAQQFAKAPAQFLQLPSLAGQHLHRRAGGRELPWVRMDEGDPYETYEAPILAEPGRYLWVRLELTGNARTTPRFRAIRAEYPAHDYLRRLPNTFSRDEQAASFLHRYLGLFEGVLSELEAKADARALLLNPLSAPAEMLPWLAGFLGLTLDERMAHAPRPNGQIEDVRRTLIAEATWLFRLRGTVPGLRRWLEIYLGVEPIIIEKFRVRGLGGALLGDASGLASNSVLGAGFRIGGALGEDETQVLTGTIDDAFATHAHRFTVVIPAVLTSEQQDVVQQILDVHRPAHTLVEVCTVSAGMRVGRGLHVALTSILGPSGGFRSMQLGNATLGRGSILGRPEAGTILGSAQLGGDSRVG
jgi:phage tail-like protein